MTTSASRRKIPGWVGFVAAVVLVSSVGGGVFWWKTRSHTRAPAAYEVVTVSKGSLNRKVLSTGLVQSENRLDVKPPVAGRVESILVEEGQKVKRGQIIAWMSSTERAALLDTARSKGAAELKYWEEAYKAIPIVAPINGEIILKSVERGQTMTATDSLLTMSDRLIVRANVDETDISQIHDGQRADMLLDAFPENNIGGKVERIAFDAKTVNNVTTYAVDVVPDSVPPFMKSGMTANLTFMVGKKDDVLFVPSAAIHRESNQAVVMVPNPDPKGQPIPREIVTGIVDGKKTEVVSGLAENDKIVISNLSAIPRNKDAKNKSPFSPFGQGGGGRPPRR